MIIRPFNHSHVDYDSIIDIQNTAFPDNRCDVTDWKARDENYPKKYLRERLVAEDSSGKIVGYSFYCESEWSYLPGKFLVLVTVHPDFQKQGIGSALYDSTIKILESKNSLRYESATRENQPKGMRFLAKRGFQMVMREPISQLDLSTFDPNAYEHYKQRLVSAQIDVFTGTELLARDPNFWRKLYELDWEIEQDIPSPYPPTKPDFDRFMKRRTDPRHSFRLDGLYVGVDKSLGDDDVGAYVGLSNLQVDLADRTKLHIGITGVARTYRRLGIGTALKMKAMDFAAEYGATLIETKNEENNPMFQLNIGMGFREVTAELEYEKQL